MPYMYDIILCVSSYLLGSIPFGYLVSRFKGLDIQQHGSKNIGATNVTRHLGKVAGAITLIADAGKGAVAVYCAHYYGDHANMVYIAAFAVVVGHMYPVWLKFKGGKGVATYLGVLLMLNRSAFVIFFMMWIFSFVTSKYASLSSISSVLIVLMWMFMDQVSLPSLISCSLITALIVYKHKDNIKRLMSKEELVIGQESGQQK